MNLHQVPQEGFWYRDIDGHTSFEVLSIDDKSHTAIIHLNSGSVEEIDLDMWEDMNLKRIEAKDAWGEAHMHAFDIMDENEDIYNTDSLHLSIEPDDDVA